MRFLSRYCGASLAVVAAALLQLIAAAPAHALTYIGSASQSGLNVIVDGTSNTIAFGELTRAVVCVGRITTQGASSLTDGSSNTIQFSESVTLRINAGGIQSRQQIGGIVDGTSNTIVLGEIPTTDYCLTGVTFPLNPIVDGTSNTILLGEGSQFDVCFDNVDRSITDGTSNTILIGESASVSRACYEGGSYRAAPVNTTITNPPAAVPEPSAVALLGLGLMVLGVARARGHSVSM